MQVLLLKMLFLQMHVRLQLLQTSLLDGSTAEQGGLLTAQLGRGQRGSRNRTSARREQTWRYWKAGQPSTRWPVEGSSNRGQRHGTGMDLRDKNEGGTP